jgi:hypothetical protein
MSSVSRWRDSGHLERAVATAGVIANYRICPIGFPASDPLAAVLRS